MKRIGMHLLPIAALTFSLAAVSHAGGPMHGAKATGFATAFTALADDPSAIMYNPAGLMLGSGARFMGGVTYMNFKSTYEPDAGEDADSVYHPFFPPHLFADSDLPWGNWRFGLGVHAPYGSGGRVWGEDSSARYQSVENLISTIAVNPTVAWRVNPALSVGFGATAMRADLKMKKAIDQSFFGAKDAMVENEADGIGYGWNAGILFCPSEAVRLGFTYRSKVKVEMEGDLILSSIAPPARPLFGGASFKSPMETTINFPDVYNVGVAWFPREDLTIVSDIEWTQWSSLDEVGIDLEREVPAANFGDTTERLAWNDVWMLKVGAQWEAKKWVRLRGGYAYVQTYVPGGTLAAGNPEANQHNFSVGGGVDLGRTTLDAFYSLGLFEDRLVDNPVASGEFKNVAHYAGLSITAAFGGKK